MGCLSVQKLYGRDIANTETISSVFHMILGKLPAAKVLRAFEVWIQRSSEFPTPADIISLVKRNGAPPLEKAVYIAISRKDAEHRTPGDWRYLQEYEAQANDDEFGSEFVDPVKQEVSALQGQRLRERIAELEQENRKLADLLHDARMAKGIEPPKPTHAEKVDKTIDYLRATGADEGDILDFIVSQGLPATYGLVAA